jgi:AraC-like DNA-binding protein
MANNETLLPMTSRATVLAVWLRPLVDFLESLGIDSRAVFAYTGVDIDHAFVPGVRLPLTDAAPLWGRAAQVTGRPFLSLELAKFAPVMQGGTVSVSMLASRNLYEALHRYSRLSTLICEGVQLRLNRVDDDLRLEIIVPPEEREAMPHVALEPAFVPVLSFLDKGLLAAGSIKRLEFERKYPGDEAYAQLQEMFPIPMSFGCEPLAMVFDWKLSQTQNPYWDPTLAQASEALALESIEQLNDRNIVGRVKKLVLELLPEGKPEQARIAALLNITPRSLQRQLENKGISYSDVVQETRHELACRYLQDRHMTLVDVALNLGFQDQSNFAKAFKSWHQMTPGQFRKLSDT